MQTLSHDDTQPLDELCTCLNQMDALLDVVMSADLIQLKPATLLNYLWVISNVIHTAKKICEDSMHA